MRRRSRSQYVGSSAAVVAEDAARIEEICRKHHATAVTTAATEAESLRLKVARRAAFWKPDFGSADAFNKSIDANRQRLAHILGVRAFGTQLLCEQVVGRALRRQSYELNDENLFTVEYADIFGIPFDFAATPAPSPQSPSARTAILLSQAV